LSQLRALLPGALEILPFRAPDTLQEDRPFPHIKLDHALEALVGDLLK
jgi:predicted YcjX-like family ATPase